MAEAVAVAKVTAFNRHYLLGLLNMYALRVLPELYAAPPPCGDLAYPEACLHGHLTAIAAVLLPPHYTQIQNHKSDQHLMSDSGAVDYHG